MPLTEAASAKAKRNGVEKPFVADEKYLVFPEVARGQLTGFFVYLGDQSWYFDTIEEIAPKSGRTPLSGLQGQKNLLYRMIVQPDGLETLTLEYLPGPLVEGEVRSTSIGARVTQPRQHAPLPSRIVRLVTHVAKTEVALMAPLVAEYELRKAWIQAHNLNQDSFRQLTALMQSDCHE